MAKRFTLCKFFRPRLNGINYKYGFKFPSMFALENLERFSSNRFRIARLQRIKLLLRVLALVALIAAGKVAAHRFGWEVIQLNPLFTTLVASTVFYWAFCLTVCLLIIKRARNYLVS